MIPLIAGALISAAGSAYANRQAKKSADKQMSFQQSMSNTSYQRAMADMKAAGLNPMLAYQQGGASTPQGARVQNFQNVGDAAVKGASSAQQIGKMQSEVKKIDQEIDNLMATEFKTDSETQLNVQKLENLTEEFELIKAKTRLTSEQAEMLQFTSAIEVYKAAMLEAGVDWVKSKVKDAEGSYVDAISNVINGMKEKLGEGFNNWLKSYWD